MAPSRAPVDGDLCVGDSGGDVAVVDEDFPSTSKRLIVVSCWIRVDGHPQAKFLPPIHQAWRNRGGRWWEGCQMPIARRLSLVTFAPMPGIPT